MKKTPTKKAKKAKKAKTTKTLGFFDHECDWKTAAIKLARCVVATLQADGKIGVGSGLVMKVENGKRIIERWDKDFHEALAFIGIEVVDKPKKTKPRRSAAAAGRTEGAAA